MGYKHQTPNLKQAIPKRELEQHIARLHKAFPGYKSTGYTQPDGENWQKHVKRHKYQIYPVDWNFGIAIDIGNEPHGDFNQRMTTLYPKLELAVMNTPRGLTGNTNRRNSFIEKLSRLGYKLTKEESVEK